MKTLSTKQKEIVSKFDITVEKDSQNGYYSFLIAGVYYQQKGYRTEIEAFEAGIGKALENKR